MSESSLRGEIRGSAVVVRGVDIDTDRIIPARYLRTVTFDGLGDHVFEDDRAVGGHPFDEVHFAGASILVTNGNFGCGSSREHAPQALMRWGIGAFVGESFAEIFFGNCLALGLPCLTASEADIALLQEAVDSDPTQEVIVNVSDSQVAFDGGYILANIPDGPREQLVGGSWDALGQLLEAGEAIAATAKRLPYTNGFADS